MTIFYKHKTSLMLLCKGLVFLYLFIIVIVIVISYYIFIYFIIHVHSFDWAKERTKKTHAADKNLRILLLKQKIRTRHTATNKNFHGTRCAQTPGNFYCFLVNAAKFLMPRLHLTRTFNFLIRRKYIINDNKKYYSSHQP